MLAPVVTVRFTCARCFSSSALVLECRRPFQLIAGSKRPRHSGMASAAAPGSALAKSIDDLAVEDQPSTSVRPSDDSLVQYVVLRRDLWVELGWPLGSIVAQACHAATAALWLSREQPEAAAYCAPEKLDYMHKVVLEVKGETQLRALAEKLAAAEVRHKLWVEQPEDFPTCVATAPYPKAAVQQHFKKLKLCKGS